MSNDSIFALVYILGSVFIIIPPTEFISAGFTIEHIFGRILGNQHEAFVLYHIRKSCLNLLIYSLLPIGYIVSSYLLGYAEIILNLSIAYPILSTCLYTFALLLPFLSIYEILNWTRDLCDKHPIAINLSKFCNNNNDWKSLAMDIDMEYRSIEKTIIETSAIATVIITENWILKITPLTINIAHQSDVAVLVKEVSSFQLSSYGHALANEYLNIEVKSERQGVEPFMIRINAIDFADVKNRLSTNIAISPNVKFHQSVTEQFVEVFNDTIKMNPKYECNEVLEKCIGCMQVTANVKLQKTCDDTNVLRENRCVNCYCRPMWCSDCMARWFASRQEGAQEQWLSSKCTCPMCRATFCMLDVCLVTNSNHDTSS